MDDLRISFTTLLFPRILFSAARSVCLLLVLFLLTLPLAAEDTPLVAKNFQCHDSEGGPRPKVGRPPVALCKIGDLVKVGTMNLDEWLRTSGHSLDKLVLVLDGQLLVGQSAAYDDGSLTFYLKRNHSVPENIAAWKHLLARTTFFDPREMTISLGIEGTIERHAPERIGLTVASQERVFAASVLYAVLVVSFVLMAIRSDLLRDYGNNPSAGSKPFSLGSTQFAFWFFIVIAGFIYLWLVTGEIDTLTPGVLALIGISAATGLAATAIGTSRQISISAKRLALEDELDRLDVRLTQLADQLGTTPQPANASVLQAEQSQKNARLEEVNVALSALPTTTVQVSRGFFADILSSDGRVTFSRFQMLAWTLVLGFVFVHAIFTTLVMPELNATLLGLMGLSSGTYVGFKFPTASGK